MAPTGTVGRHEGSCLCATAESGFEGPMGIGVEGRRTFHIEGAVWANPEEGEPGTPTRAKGPTCLDHEGPETHGEMFCLHSRHRDPHEASVLARGTCFPE